MKTTYECQKCKNIHSEVQNPGDEYERDLELCNKCRERLSPEDHFRDSTKMICDSPNTTNK
jgi:predicted SprT family Zn-dependent metalloprotease